MVSRRTLPAHPGAADLGRRRILLAAFQGYGVQPGPIPLATASALVNTWFSRIVLLAALPAVLGPPLLRAVRRSKKTEVMV